jgi:hypothetical protein
MTRRPTSSPDALTPDSLGESPPLFLPNGVPPPEEGPDPFDPESLRLPQDFSAAVGVKRALLTIPVRKPAKEWFVRTHPDAAYQLQTAVIELKEAQEVYLVHQDLWPDLAGESTFTSKMLFLTVNRQNVLFFWPVKLPGPDGRADNWSKSALDAAQLAMQRWVRVTSDQSLGAYNVYYAEHASDPVWPELSMRELLRVAFKDHYIDRLDHPILRQLRGEV